MHTSVLGKVVCFYHHDVLAAIHFKEKKSFDSNSLSGSVLILIQFQMIHLRLQIFMSLKLDSCALSKPQTISCHYLDYLLKNPVILQNTIKWLPLLLLLYYTKHTN